MPDPTFDEIMRAAEQRLLIGFDLAARFEHHGLIGTTREAVLAEFLSEQLPDRIKVTSGEAVDTQGRRSGQLDIVLYDRFACAPLLRRDSGDLLPAEALLAVIEVKSTLTQAELDVAAKAARRISLLEPFGQAFVPARQDGADFEGRCRCHYMVVAFSSNLGTTDWAAKEWQRVKRAATAAGVDAQRLDRVLVLDRGLLLPPFKRAKLLTDPGEVLLRHGFLHLVNFVLREANRRPRFEIESYGRRLTNRAWVELD